MLTMPEEEKMEKERNRVKPLQTSTKANSPAYFQNYYTYVTQVLDNDCLFGMTDYLYNMSTRGLLEPVMGIVISWSHHISAIGRFVAFEL